MRSQQKATDELSGLLATMHTSGNISSNNSFLIPSKKQHHRAVQQLLKTYSPKANRDHRSSSSSRSKSKARTKSINGGKQLYNQFQHFQEQKDGFRDARSPGRGRPKSIVPPMRSQDVADMMLKQMTDPTRHVIKGKKGKCRMSNNVGLVKKYLNLTAQ